MTAALVSAWHALVGAWAWWLSLVLVAALAGLVVLLAYGACCAVRRLRGGAAE